ncbi:MAG: DUF6531 domain-containing protein [Pirellulaceae bacterium]|nr:DUF6531 domain-containing protein [Pirellulaceae bacterium]
MVRLLCVFLATFFPQVLLSQSTSDIRTNEFRTPTSVVKYGDGYYPTVVQACKAHGASAIPGLYYDGDFFKEDDPLIPGSTDGAGQGSSRYAYSCLDDYDNESWVELYCVSRDTSGQIVSTSQGPCLEPLNCDRCSRLGEADASAGNPTHLATGLKTETATDWISPSEPRFKISRKYVSNAENTRLTQRYLSQVMHGAGWASPFADRIAKYGSNGIPAYYQKSNGTRIALTAHWGNSTQLFDGSSIDVQFYYERYNKRWLILRDGSGVVRHFFGQNGSWDHARLARIDYPDGYRINIDYDWEADVTGVNVVSDNRGNRAEFQWTQLTSGKPETSVVTSVQVDPSYDGVTFSPQAEVQYDYQQTVDDTPVLEEARRLDIAAGAVTIVAQYEYENFQRPGFFPPHLREIKDGNGNTRIEVEYQGVLALAEGGGDIIYSSAFRSAVAGPAGPSAPFIAVAKTQRSGGAYAHEFQEPTATIAEFEGPLGTDTTHAVALKGDRIVTTQVDVSGTASTAATTTAYDYTAPAGSPEGYLYSRTERNGAVTSYTRDSRGRILTQTEDALGTTPRTTTYTYAADNFAAPVTRQTDQLLEEFTYNADKLLVSYAQTDVQIGSPNLGDRRQWDYTYSTLSSGLQVLTQVDGPGLLSNGVADITTYTYDASGRLLTTTDPNGLVTEVLTYGDLGLPTLVRDASRLDWVFTYDEVGRVLTSTLQPDKNAETTTFSYDDIGQLISVTDPMGRVWGYAYDAARRLTQVTSPSGETMTYTYDAAGNVTNTSYLDASSALVYQHTSAFDALGRVTQALGDNGQVNSFGYDIEDNLTNSTDAQGFQTANSFDALNRVIQTVDRGAHTTLMEYDTADRQTRYTDPRLIDTQFEYNGFGDLVSETSADRGTITYTHDLRGLVTSMTDSRGVVTNYEYDDGGRLTARRFPSDASLDVEISYYTSSNKDGYLGKVRRIDSSVGRTWRYYENHAQRGFLDRDWQTIEGTTYKTKYAYNANEEVTRIWYPSGSQARLYYDGDGNLTQIKWQGKDPNTGTNLSNRNVLNNMDYLPFGPMVSGTYGDGGSHTRTHDTSHRLLHTSDTGGAGLLRDITHSWTTRNNLASVTDNLDPSKDQNFSYSAREFLASADGPWGTKAYAYDSVGNRTSLATTLAGITGMESYNYPASSNQLQTVALGSTPIRQFTYDTAGNVTFDSRSGTSYGYTYNAANRLESLSVGGIVQAEYEYNGLGQQAVRRLTQTGEVIHCVFDRDGRRLSEYSIDTLTGTSTHVRDYIWNGLELVGIYEGNELFYVRTDHIARPVFATNASGTVVWEASYLPFGGVQSATGGPDLRFPGQWFQSESGLHQNWMRDYDPTLGRYLQADPLGLIDGASVYGYALQNPGRYVDPRGMEAATIGGAAIIAGGAAMLDSPLPGPADILAAGLFLYLVCDIVFGNEEVLLHKSG